MNLLAFQAKFPDEAACENHLIQVRWPEGFICGHCQSQAAWYIQSRRTFQCKQCRRQESITANTMFHRSRTSLQEWFLAIYLVCESKKGISCKRQVKFEPMRQPNFEPPSSHPFLSPFPLKTA